MKLELALCESERSDNLFVKLHPSTVHQLYFDAIASFSKEQRQGKIPSEFVNNDWTIANESPDDIQFLPLRVDFRNDEGAEKSMYCSYNGGPCEKEGCIQMPMSLPGTLTGVFAINAVKSASTVYIEPATSSDWELLEIYANELEGGMLLNQLSIVYPLAHLTLKLGRDSVHIKVLENGFHPSDPCLRLVADTEIIVAPKPRTKDSGSESPYPPSEPIRIFPSEANLSLEMIKLHRQFCEINSTDEKMTPCPPILTAWMHPNTLASVPGWNVTDSNSLSTSLNRRTAQTVHVVLQNEKKTTVAQLASSEHVPTNCIVLHPHLGFELGTSPLYHSIQVQILKEPQIEERRQALFEALDESSISVHLAPFTISASTDISRAWNIPEDCKSDRSVHESRYRDYTRIPSQGRIQSKGQFLAAWSQVVGHLLDEKTMLSHGIIVPLPAGNDQWTLYQLHVKEQRRPKDRERFESSRKIFRGKGCKHLITAQDLASIPELIIGTEYSSLGTENMFNILPVSLSSSKRYLDHVISAESKLIKNISNCSPNNIIICGERGCGKTHFCMMLSARLRMSHSFATFYLDCRQLQSAQIRMGGILAELTEIFKRTMECQHSLLVLDNLDELIPNTNNSSSNEDGSIHHQQGKNPMMVNQAKLLADHTKFLIRGLKRTQAYVICTCNGEETKLHAGLRSVQTFTKKVKVPILEEMERCNIIFEDLEQHGISSSAAINSLQLAKETDGYLPRDMKVLAARLSAQHRKHVLGLQRDVSAGTPIELSSALGDILSNYIPINQRMLDLERTKCSLTWSQIGGLFQAKAALSDIILRPVKYSLIYKKAPISLPRGIMLYGYPGCGKSCIVPALAEECGFNLVTCRGPELLDKYIGASEAKVRQLFEKAYAAAPSILFLDEFDALAPRRGSDNTGVTDRVVNQLLTFLDGVEVKDTEDEIVYIIGASSRPDKIDPALLRPGRLEKHIFIGYQQNESEWNDLLLKMSQRWNLDQETRQAIQDNTLQRTLDKRGVHFKQFSAADVKGVFDTAHLSAVHDIIDCNEHTADMKDQENTKQLVTIRRDHLIEAFLTARPSLSKRDRRILGDTYVPFLGSNKDVLEGLGLEPDSLSAIHATKLKTALK